MRCDGKTLPGTNLTENSHEMIHCPRLPRPLTQTAQVVPANVRKPARSNADLFFTRDGAEYKEACRNEIVEANEHLPPCPRRGLRIWVTDKNKIMRWS